MSSEAEPTQRLFFALWPNDVVREQLHRAGRRIHKQGKQVARDNLHITLVFVGSVNAEQRDCMIAAAEAVSGQPFELRFEKAGVFGRSRVQWLAPGETPEAMLTLARDLSAALEPCGYEPERRPYRAHVTTARKVTRPTPVTEIDPIHWSVSDFARVESVTHQEGPEYRVLKRWNLD